MLKLLEGSRASLRAPHGCQTTVTKSPQCPCVIKESRPLGGPLRAKHTAWESRMGWMSVPRGQATCTAVHSSPDYRPHGVGGRGEVQEESA